MAFIFLNYSETCHLVSHIKLCHHTATTDLFSMGFTLRQVWLQILALTFPNYVI